MSLRQEFNERSQTIQTLDAEICKTVKEVKELQSTLTAATGKVNTGSEVLQTGQAVPPQRCTIKESELPSVQPSVLGFLVSPNQFSILSEDEVA